MANMEDMDPGGEVGPPKMVAGEICILVDGAEVSLDDYVESLVSGEDAAVKDSLVACLAELLAEGAPANELQAAIKSCIASAVLVEQAPDPENPGVTITMITVSGKPAVVIRHCCPGPTIVIPDDSEDPAADAADAADGQPAGTQITFGSIEDGNYHTWIVDPSGAAILHESPVGGPPPVVTTPDTGDPGNPAGPSTVTISGVTFCEGATGAVYDKPQNPYPSNPTGRLAQEHGGRDGKDEVWLQAPEHYSSCIEGNSTTRVWYDINAPAGTTVERLLEYQISLTNLSDCRRASVTVSHTGHTLGAFYMPGDEFFVFSGDRVFINGFQGSWGARSVSWQFQNATSLRATFEAANQGYEGCYKLGPLATLRADIFTRTASAGSFPTIISTNNPAGTVLEQMHGSMHLTTE